MKFDMRGIFFLEDRRQKTEDRRQKTEDRRWKMEDGNKKLVFLDGRIRVYANYLYICSSNHSKHL